MPILTRSRSRGSRTGNAVDVSRTEHHLVLCLEVAVVIVDAEQALHADVHQVQVIGQFLCGGDIRRIRHIEVLHFGVGSGVLVDQVLAELGVRVLILGALRGRNAIDHGPIEIRTGHGITEVVIEHVDVVLAVLQRGIVLHSD